MKDILMITHFTQVPGENGNGRFDYLAKMLVENHAVEMVTTSFSHRNKAQRVVSHEQRKALPYTLTMLREPGYKKNVSLVRFYSHHQFGRSLRAYLKTRKKPDLIYCTAPSLDAAYEAAVYAQKHGVPLVIDIQDLWPEAFEMVFHVPVVSTMLFAPMKKKADRIYRCAKAVLAVSQTYVNRALSVNTACDCAKAVFLGTDLAYFDRCRDTETPLAKTDAFVIGYAGTLGHSYDLCTVIDAVALLQQRGKTYRLHIMGDGPLKAKFEAYAAQRGVDACFTGRLPYPEMVAQLCSCDAAINSITSGAAQSIINKHGDYAAAGIPVISTQESPEYRRLVEEYHMGFNVANGNAEEMAAAFERLRQDEALREQMGQGARRCAEERFDRRKTYHAIVDLIDTI